MKPLTYEFGDWLPDMPDMLNPSFPAQLNEYFTGGKIDLLTAQNCIYTSGSYQSYKSLSAISQALGAACLNAIAVYDTNGDIQIFAGTATDLFKYDSGAGTWTNVSKAAGAYNASEWSFQAFGNCLTATDYNDPIQQIDATTGVNFADLDTVDPAPKCKVLGQIRDFLFAGYTNDATNGVVPFRLQWSALGICGSWPLPGTQAAFAAQASAQTLYSEYGPIMGIGDNEGFGLVFQQNGISRADYVGGDTVFRFDTYEKKNGLAGPSAFVRVGNLYFFLAPSGFKKTDGSQCQPIGYGKVDNWFLANVKAGTLSNVRAAADVTANIVYWAFQSTTGTGLDSLLIYNYVEDKWTYCLQAMDCLFGIVNGGKIFAAGAFDTTHKYGQFTGAPANATLITRDLQLNPAGRALVTQIRPLIQGAATAAVASRSDQVSSPSFTSYNAQGRSGMVGVRREGLYHRIGVKTSGSFSHAVGATVWAQQAGQI